MTEQKTNNSVTAKNPSKSTNWALILVCVLILVIGGVFIITRTNIGPLNTTPGQLLRSVAPAKNESVKEMKKIGIIIVWRRLDRFAAGLKAGLRELGYQEGVDIVYKYNSWEHDPTKIDPIVQSYIDEDVDLMYGINAPSALHALALGDQANKKIPVVYALVDEPITVGLIDSFQNSGERVTGVASNMGEMVQKQLEILKRILPNAKRLGIFSDGFKIPGLDAPGTFVLKAMREHVGEFGLELVEYTTTLTPADDLEKEFARIANSIKPGDIDALYHTPGHFFVYQDVSEVELGDRLGIPVVMPIGEEVESSGGLFSVSADNFEVGKQSAIMVDKIFKGDNPSGIPSEMPRKNIMTLNLSKAEELGIKIPQDIIDIADVTL